MTEEDKYTRYHQRQREKGHTQCTTWVPAASKKDLLEYARQLRERYEAEYPERGESAQARAEADRRLFEPKESDQ